MAVSAPPYASFPRDFVDGEELPIAYGARVTFFAGPKKVTKETAWLTPVRHKS
jgi:hypothetical protein